MNFPNIFTFFLYFFDLYAYFYLKNKEKCFKNFAIDVCHQQSEKLFKTFLLLFVKDIQKQKKRQKILFLCRFFIN
ncbi:MAG: hypothetical protein EAZ85_04595 [Bacteroidetes bacterium]|nr:MAG: hypothetical protein EAZ85_04595 [Bacteroidota bacterium]TAG89967.1 MAG: hypothetical protein EAZ20_05305 [Bacteroidota bacterium]